MSDWDDPQTAAYYEAFCQRCSRYERANRELASHARLEPGMSVLDLAAGTGRTAEAALMRLGPNSQVLCVVPSAAMRAVGMRRLKDSPMQWSTSLTEVLGSFDRILCGAAIWQLNPLCETLRTLAGLLRPGGRSVSIFRRSTCLSPTNRAAAAIQICSPCQLCCS
jgi:ubiquinone/menaquinone biosynthesis C-methylase UbiE